MSRRFASCVGHLENGTICGEPVDTFAHPELGFPIFSRGGRNAYFCPQCARRVESYYAENSNWIGTWTSEKISYSYELEVSYFNQKSNIELQYNHFLPTHDSTVAREYKSPIYRNCKSVVHYSKTIQSLLDSGDLEIGSSCGTHFHVGQANFVNADTMERFYRKDKFYRYLFKPLADVMLEDSSKTRTIFGRDFGTWAQYPDFQDPENHTNFVNVQHDWTFEWRIVKFSNADQFSTAAMFCKKLTSTIFQNFSQYIPDCGNDTVFMLRKAEVAGRKLAKLFNEMEV